jgi:hypothetical protein
MATDDCIRRSLLVVCSVVKPPRQSIGGGDSVIHLHPSPSRGAGSIRGRVVCAAPERIGRLARPARSAHPLPKVRSGGTGRASRTESPLSARGDCPAKIGFPSRTPAIEQYRKTRSRSWKAKQKNFLVFPLDGYNEALKIGVSNSSHPARNGPRWRKPAGPMLPQEGGAAGAPEHFRPWLSVAVMPIAGSRD